MWKLDDCYSTTEKLEKSRVLGEMLLSLSGKIEEIKSISVYYNDENAVNSNYDLVLNSSFNSLEDLQAYGTHPEHQKVAEYSKTIKKSRACIDYRL